MLSAPNITGQSDGPGAAATIDWHKDSATPTMIDFKPSDQSQVFNICFKQSLHFLIVRPSLKKCQLGVTSVIKGEQEGREFLFF